MSKFFILDTETLGLSDSHVVLSLAICCVDLNFAMHSTPNELYNHVLENSKFIKFDAIEQKMEYRRLVSDDTLEWWKKIPLDIQKMSLIPSPDDFSSKDGLTELQNYMDSIPESGKFPIYQRGYLDGSILLGLSDSVGVKCPLNAFRFRDVRTFVDVLYGSNDGYADVDNFDKTLVKKHDPIHDIARDCVIMVFGKHIGETDGQHSKADW